MSSSLDRVILLESILVAPDIHQRALTKTSLALDYNAVKCAMAELCGAVSYSGAETRVTLLQTAQSPSMTALYNNITPLCLR